MWVQLILLVSFTSSLHAVVWHRLPPPWSYECQDGACVKLEASKAVTYQTLDACKLTCDEFSNVWPKPTGKFSKGDKVIPFVFENLKIVRTAVPNTQVGDMAKEAVKLFKMSLKKYIPDYNEASEEETMDLQNEVFAGEHSVKVELIVRSPDVSLNMKTDESYTLRIDTAHAITSVVILAPTYYGVRHGLETLSQLINYDSLHDSLQILDSVVITDKPKYKHRGFILDTSRNFYSVKSLKKLICAMSYDKLNVFHWHITDSHSFPFYSSRVPLMTYYGAYSPKDVYNPSEIKELVEYARIRGVKIIPEFDAPAHVGNGWQWGEKEGKGVMAVCVNQEPWEKYCVEPPCGQLNPLNDNVYDVLGDIYKDLFDVFDSDVFHMGGDEVHTNCWNTSSVVLEEMKKRQIGRSQEDFYDLWAEFQEKALKKVYEANKGKLPAILWTSHLTESSHVTKYLSPDDYIIQLWTTGEDKVNKELLNNDFKLIFSNYDSWYLDCGYGHWVTDGNNWCSPYKGWQKVYDFSPRESLRNQSVTDENKLLQVLGGEVAMWSEQVDEYSVESKIWPRASALSERLWSDPAHKWREAETRMIQHRHRLMQRGVMAERLQPEWCRQNEGKCRLQKEPEKKNEEVDATDEQMTED